MPGRNLLAGDIESKRGRNLLADEPQNGNTRQGQQANQGQLDQLKMLEKLDRFVNKGNTGRATTALMQAANSSTLGGLDSVLAGAERVVPGASGASPRGVRRQLRENHPTSATVGDIVGFLGPGGAAYNLPIQLGKQLPKLPGKALPYMQRLTGMAIGGGAANAAYEGTVGASNEAADTGQPVTLPERAQMAVEGATDPLALAAGPVASGLYRGGRGLVTGKVTPKSMQPGTNAPSVDAISDMKDAAYKASDELGVTYTADGFQNLVASIENKMQSLGLDPVLHQRPARMLKVIQDRVGSPKTLQEIDNIRKIVRRDVVNSAPRDGGDAERMLGGVIIDEIDNFIQAGQNVARGDGPDAANAILKARHLNTVYKKAQVLEDAMERAKNRTATTGSGGNFYNALGQEIRKIYENPKKSAAFNQAEKAAMKKVIDGEPVQNLLRNIGKLSPQGNGLMAAIGIGSSATNPITAPFFIGGIAAKHMAEKGIKNKFDDLDAIVRSGANRPPMRNVTPPRSGAGGPMPGPGPTTPPRGPAQRLSPSSLLNDTPAPGAIARPLSDSLLDETITAPVDDVAAANRYFGRKSFRSENRGAAGLPKKRPDPKDLKKKKKDKKKPRD